MLYFLQSFNILLIAKAAFDRTAAFFYILINYEKVRSMKIKKLVKLTPMMLLTFLLGLSGCSGSTSADARVNDHPNEADEELHVLTIGTADSGGTMYSVGSAIASVLSGHDEQLKVNLSASNASYTNVENTKTDNLIWDWSAAMWHFPPYQGTDEFSGHPVESLRAIGAVYLSLSTWMAPGIRAYLLRS